MRKFIRLTNDSLGKLTDGSLKNQASDVKLTDGSLRKVAVLEPAEASKEELNFERQMTSSIVPVFDDIDFARYPRLIDDTNPMHRLWSDGAWIKAYMAHGC